MSRYILKLGFLILFGSFLLHMILTTFLISSSIGRLKILSDLNQQHAKNGQFPWVAVLTVKKSDNLYLKICDGTLISTSWILTVGTCIQRAEDYTKIISGLGSVIENDQLVWIGSKKFLYCSIRNLGLIQLQSEVPSSEYIKPILLPSTKFTPNDDKDNHKIVGFLNNKIAQHLSLLKYYDVILRRDLYCRLIFKKELFEVICAELVENNLNLCSISGGAIYSSRQIIGVIDLENRLCDEDTGIIEYILISPYLDWIERKTGIPVAEL